MPSDSVTDREKWICWVSGKLSGLVKNDDLPGSTGCSADNLSYCKTPLISTYVFSGLATVQVLIFGGRTYFRGV